MARLKTRENSLLAAAKRAKQFENIKAFKKDVYNPKRLVKSMDEGTGVLDIVNGLKKHGVVIHDTREYKPSKTTLPLTTNEVLKEHYKRRVSLVLLQGSEKGGDVNQSLTNIFAKAHSLRMNSCLILEKIINSCRFKKVRVIEKFEDLNDNDQGRFTVKKFHSTFYYDEGVLKFLTQIIFFDKKSNSYLYYSVMTLHADPIKHQHDVLNELVKRVNTIFTKDKGYVQFTTPLTRYFHVYVYHYVRGSISTKNGKKMDTGTDIYRVLHYNQFKGKAFEGSPDVMKSLSLLGIGGFYTDGEKDGKISYSSGADKWGDEASVLVDIVLYLNMAVTDRRNLYNNNAHTSIHAFNRINDVIKSGVENGK